MSTPESPASAQRPIKRLKGFERVTIPVGQTKTVEITIDCSDLWFWDMEEDRICYDGGRYDFEIGSSSKDIRAVVSAEMDPAFTPELKVVVADCGASVLRQGETAKTSFTACLTDDSFIDPSEASVRYASNNPAVLSVGSDGVVKAEGQGVATVTVYVEYEGVTRSGSYAVKVMPDLSLASLTVGGKSVLKADVSQYSVLGKASAAAPEVSAKAADPSLEVVVEQAEAVPGTAVVRVVDKVTSDFSEYVVNFGVKGVSDEFKASAPASAWTVLREDKSAWSVADGALRLTTSEGDITLANNNASNLFLQSANTDWTADTRLSFSAEPGYPAQNAGLLAYQDDDNFVRLSYGVSMSRRGPAGASLQLLCESDGYTTASVNVNVEGVKDNTLWLRLVKSGSEYTAYYSVDGRKFVEAGSVSAVLEDVQAGLIACDGAMPAMNFRGFGSGAQAPETEPVDVAFDYFRIRSSASR